MTRPICAVYLALGLLAAGCGAESEPQESAPPPNPIERRAEPLRQRGAEADSLIRLREQEVRDLTRPEG